MLQDTSDNVEVVRSSRGRAETNAKITPARCVYALPGCLGTKWVRDCGRIFVEISFSEFDNSMKITPFSETTNETQDVFIITRNNMCKTILIMY